MEPAEAPEITHGLEGFSDQVSKIRGVLSASVREDPEVSVELIASRDRGAKEIVRDVQSLAAAGFGLSIDHRAITIEWDSNSERGESRVESANGRPVMRWINVSSDLRGGRVDVGLLSGGKETTGGATFPPSASGSVRALAAARATAKALEPTLNERDHKLAIEGCQAIAVAGRRWILVSAVYDDGEGGRPLLGAALLEDDPVGAGARALLDGLNRSVTR